MCDSTLFVLLLTFVLQHSNTENEHKYLLSFLSFLLTASVICVRLFLRALHSVKRKQRRKKRKQNRTKKKKKKKKKKERKKKDKGDKGGE